MGFILGPLVFVILMVFIIFKLCDIMYIMYKIRLYIIVHNSVKLKWVNLNSGYHMIG